MDENTPQEATGGFVPQPEPHAVGERGPELFIPPRPGWVICHEGGI